MTTALVQQISFHDDRVSVMDQDGQRFVAVKPICTNIGLDWTSQVKLIKRDERLSSTMVIMTTVGEDNKTREMLCLPLRYIPLWLAKLNPGRYRGATRDRLMRYQEECADVLYRHLMGRIPAIRRVERPRDGQGFPAGRTVDASGLWLTIHHVAFLEARSVWAIEKRVRRGTYPPKTLREVPSHSGRFATRKEVHFSALSAAAQERYFQAIAGELPDDEGGEGA